ncbi:alpha/beta fold hydrolase [Howardella ureilytica]
MKKLRPTTLLIDTALALLVVKGINNMIFKTARKNKLTGDYVKYDFTYKNTTVNYIKKGSGSPILLIHDISTFSSVYEWNKTMEKLSKKHTVYAVDLPGCGHSEKDPITYTIYLYQLIIGAFIKRVIRQKTDIVTSGLSSAIAIQLKYYEPALINKVILSAPVAPSAIDKLPDKSDEFIKNMMNFQIAGTSMYNIYTSRLGAYIKACSQISKGNRKLKRDTYRIYYENSHIGGSNNKYLSSSLVNGFLFSKEKKLIPSIDNIYIINGYDEPDRREIVEEFKKLNNTTHVITVNNSRYLPHLEKATTFSNVVLKIINGAI